MTYLLWSFFRGLPSFLCLSLFCYKRLSTFVSHYGVHVPRVRQPVPQQGRMQAPLAATAPQPLQQQVQQQAADAAVAQRASCVQLASGTQQQAAAPAAAPSPPHVRQQGRRRVTLIWHHHRQRQLLKQVAAGAVAPLWGCGRQHQPTGTLPVSEACSAHYGW